MKVEVIATNLTDAIIADENGADRLELVTGIVEGGLTPSYGLIDAVVQKVNIPVNVIVRPHSQSFYYNDDDLRTMLTDIRTIKKIGASGIVIGALTRENDINTEAMKRLLSEADELDVTFHRAFDKIEDQVQALNVLSQFPQIKRVLTSGGKDAAMHSIRQIKKLVHSATDTSLTVMAGHGLTIEGLEEFLLQTNVEEVHFGSAVRVHNDYLRPIQGDKIKTIKNIVNVLG